MYSLANKTLNLNEILQINKEYQIYVFFVVFLISLQLICNTIEPIIIHFSIFELPASAIFYVLSFALSDVMTENFGFKLAVRATVLNVIAQIIYCGIAAIVYIILGYQKTTAATSSFSYIFHFLSLEFLSSILALLISMTFNDYLINKLKMFFMKGSFWWRTIMATVLGEFIMLNIDYNITFFGSKSLLTIQYLIINAMSYKILAAIVLSLPATLLSKHVSNHVFFLRPKLNQKIHFISEFKNALFFK